MKTPSAILSADIHAREDKPICRLDEYWEAFTKKLKWLKDLQVEHGCPILDAGDLLNRHRISPHLEQYLIRNMPDNFITVPGNHDLPNHNLAMYDKSSLSVLEASGKVKVLKHDKIWDPCDYHSQKILQIYGVPYGPFDTTSFGMGGKYNILILHTMTWTGREPYPGAGKEGDGATALLKKYPDFDLILTGHNHQSFTAEYRGRLLVNPGSMMRSTADQIEHKPCVYLWYAESNTVEPVYYPIEKGVISREHISETKERDERVSAFVTRLKTDTELGLSFEKNMEGFLGQNKVHEDTTKIIWEAIDGQGRDQ